MIFPFSKTTETLSAQCSKTAQNKNPAAPNYTRLMIEQIKALEQQYYAEQKKHPAGPRTASRVTESTRSISTEVGAGKDLSTRKTETAA